jgi:hypothetical protein
MLFACPVCCKTFSRYNNLQVWYQTCSDHAISYSKCTKLHHLKGFAHTVASLGNLDQCVCMNACANGGHCSGQRAGAGGHGGSICMAVADHAWDH